MTVRIATFNVENLFARPKVFSLPDWAQGQPILDAFSQFNALVEKPAYSAADKARMAELLVTLEIYSSDGGVIHRNRVPDPAWAWLRANKGTFDIDHHNTGIEIVASGRDAWTGWAELAKAPANEVATQMTAKVIGDVNADLLCVVEVKDRPSLDRFNRDMLGGRYAHAILIDGNDPRGIDVGILTKAGFDIANMRSNVDIADPVTAPEHLFSHQTGSYSTRRSSTLPPRPESSTWSTSPSVARHRAPRSPSRATTSPPRSTSARPVWGSPSCATTSTPTSCPRSSGRTE